MGAIEQTPVIVANFHREAPLAYMQFADQRLYIVLAVALLATAPVMALPLAHLEGDRPGLVGVLAALLALAGVSCVVA